MLCVVLNNQHQNRIDEFVEINHNTPDRPVLFQPYTEKHLRQAYELAKGSDPISIFLVVGNYGEVVKAVGLLHSVEYKEDLLPTREQELAQWASKYDNGIYATNILTVTNLLPLRNPIPLRNFVKTSDGKELKPGRWPASICYAPSVTQLLEAL